MWGKGMSGWEREMMEGPSPPPGLTDAELSDWARAQGAGAAAHASVMAAESAGQTAEQVTALEEAYSSLKASLPASVATIPDRRWMLWAGGAVVVGYLVLRRRKRRKVARK